MNKYMDGWEGFKKLMDGWMDSKNIEKKNI